MMRLALILALRDSRRSALQLVLMGLLVIAGTAAFCAITLFETTLSRAVQEQSKMLLGADLAVSGRKPFSPDDVPLPKHSVKALSREISFPTMAYFPAQGRSRLVQAVALSPGFPFYGKVLTTPPDGRERLASGNALADRVLLQQSGARVGDTVRLGEAQLRLAAAVDGTPGIPASRELLAPRVFIDMADAGKTGLLSYGSRARYKVYYLANAGIDVQQLAAELEPKLIERDLSLQTVASRRERVEGTLNKVYLFLDLMSLAAIILAGLGVGGAVRLHLRNKRKSIALFRCLGATPALSSAIFIVQIVLWTAVSAVCGAALGAMLQQQLFQAVSIFLPIPVEPTPAFGALAVSVGVALSVAFIASLPPLASIARIPANAALREAPALERKGVVAELLAVLLLLGLAALYAMLNSGRPRLGLAASGVVFTIAAFITLLGVLLRGGLRRYLPRWSPYVIRQAGRNLYRPSNQTVLVLLGIGLTGYLMALSLILEESIIANFTAEQSRSTADTVFFDVQPAQHAELMKFLDSHDIEPVEIAPLVPMRLKTVAGRDVREARKSGESPEWALTREYRSTYRAHLGQAEEVIAGEFPGRRGADGAVPVSIEDRIARDLRLTLGDKFSVDVQGLEIAAYVASIRLVDWFRFAPNFFLVFPPGVLEAAPQTRVVLVAAGEKKSPAFYDGLSAKFPNVSLIDLTLTRQTLEQVIGAGKTAVNVFAFFVIGISALILAASVLSTRLSRLNEVLLFRILGARRQTVLFISFFEHLFLSLIGAASGILLAGASGWIAAVWYLKIPLVLDGAALLQTFIALLAVTVLLSLCASAGVYQRSGAELLRSGGAL